MHGKICLVTGGTSGIGRETALGLAQQGATVVVVGRDAARGEAVVADVRKRSRNDAVSSMTADLSSQHSIRRLAEEFVAQHPRLDVLVNNAGAIFGSRTLTEDGLEATLALNHLGYVLLTGLLRGALEAAAPSRVVNVASDAHRPARIDFDNLQGERSYSAWGAYGQSKLANIMFTYELSKRMRGTGVTANCLHPGVVATNFGASGTPLVRLAVKLFRPFFVSAERGAETPVYLASSADVEGVTGKYFVRKRETKSSEVSYDESIAQRLWSVSEAMTGLAPKATPPQSSNSSDA